jgi:hypothetical protein
MTGAFNEIVRVLPEILALTELLPVAPNDPKKLFTVIFLDSMLLELATLSTIKMMSSPVAADTAVSSLTLVAII